MADVAKDYGVGDTVYVTYPLGSALFFSPQQRTVKNVEIIDGANEALVTFTDGDKVQDGAVKRVYDTQALAAKAIVDDVITKIDATVDLDTTLSAVSTAGNAATGLARTDA